MAENFNLIFGSQAPETASWSDADYQKGWNTVGSTPPTAEQFDALQRRSDTKAKDLNDRLSPLETTASKALAGVTPVANMLPYFNSSNSATTTAISDFIKTLLDDGDAATARATLKANAQNCGGIIASSLNYNGYVKFANGLYLQYSRSWYNSGVDNIKLPLPITFSSKNWAILGAFISTSIKVAGIIPSDDGAHYTVYASQVPTSPLDLMTIAVGY